MPKINVHEAKTRFSKLVERAEKGEEFVAAEALLDTHLLLWAVAQSPRLGREARTALTDPANDFYFSAAGLRLLVARSLVEPMTLLTNDAVLGRYGPR